MVVDPLIAVAVIGLIGSLIAAVCLLLGGLAKNRSDRKIAGNTDLASRFDDASELARYIREEVERQVTPIREELQQVKKDSHDIQDAFRTWVSAVWLWHQRGRVGELPMPPATILTRLGLGHFVEDWPTEPSTTRRSP